jgi:hypothetical protein
MEPKPNAAGCAERKLFRDDDFFSSLLSACQHGQPVFSPFRHTSIHAPGMDTEVL